MRALTMLAAGALLGALAAGCTVTDEDDEAQAGTGGRPGGTGGEGGSGGDGALASCLDRPTALPRPPTAGLTCDLLPPGLEL